MGRSEAVSLCAQLREAIRAERGIEPALGAMQAELQSTALMLRELLAEKMLAKRDAATSGRPA